MSDTITPEERFTRRQVRTWLLGSAVLLLVRLVGEFVPLAGERGWLWITRIGEAWVVLGLFLWGLSALPIDEIRGQIGRLRTAALLGLVGLAFVGHYIGVDGDAYPFVQWSMYTARSQETVYGEIQTTLPDGATRPLPLRAGAQLSKEPRAITGRLLDLAEKAADGEERAGRLLEESLQVLVRRIPPPLPESVSVLRCTVTDPTATPPNTCETLITVEVDPS